MRISHADIFTCLLVLCITFIESGCTIGNYGSLLTRYTHTDTATVMDIYSLGAQVRTFKPDRGATLGYRRATYIFVKENRGEHKQNNSCFLSIPWEIENDKAHPRTEWCLFQSPLLKAEMLTRASTSTGIEVQSTPEIKRLNVGYLDQAITVGPELGESMIYKLDYKRNEPEKTKVFLKRYKKGEKP